MRLQTILPAALLLIPFPSSAQCSGTPVVDEELFSLLRKRPSVITRVAEYRLDLVNDRFEPCAHRKEARYVRVIRPTNEGFEVRIVTPHGFVLMTGSCSDPWATIPHGEYHYFDDAGTLRAQGRFAHGRKVGTWHRFDDLGRALPDKEYDGLDWEGQQLKLGLTSMCCYLGDE